MWKFPLATTSKKKTLLSSNDALKSHFLLTTHFSEMQTTNICLIYHNAFNYRWDVQFCFTTNVDINIFHRIFNVTLPFSSSINKHRSIVYILVTVGSRYLVVVCLLLFLN